MPSPRNSERNGAARACVRAILILSFLLMSALAVRADQLATGTFIVAGQKAPVLTLERLDGGEMTFPERGRWTIVFFWSLFCHVCIEELPMLAEEVAALPQDSVQAVFVSIDTARMKKGLGNFLKKRNLDICVALDRIVASSSYEAADAWGVKPTPAVFLVNREGVVTYSCEGPFDPEKLFGPLRAALKAPPACPVEQDPPVVAEPATMTASEPASTAGMASSAVQP
ncbi:MAG TPA: redoxin domain-containing protein [Candidatus Ozemobacteraceae bacterium]|nr:redoxin domain-containing protein [Candidatus Ozemobacteraceae bacterium]HQG27961.1 redoxin domain-containing protein [Candidatus Ozemobacteraceae bacterium]